MLYSILQAPDGGVWNSLETVKCKVGLAHLIEALCSFEHAMSSSVDEEEIGTIESKVLESATVQHYNHAKQHCKYRTFQIHLSKFDMDKIRVRIDCSFWHS